MQKIRVIKMALPEQIKEPSNVRSMILTTKIKVIKVIKKKISGRNRFNKLKFDKAGVRLETKFDGWNI